MIRWHKLTKSVRARDGHRCLECGATEELVVHHLQAGAYTDPGNMVTLCRQCHYKTFGAIHGKEYRKELIRKDSTL